MSDDRNLTLLCDPPVFGLQRVESGESGFWRVLVLRQSCQHLAPSVVAAGAQRTVGRSLRSN